ncbi:DUF6483 family protein [Paenibacillus humicola]|uniref:DUF6483 family protein n=1 Tax=Paenibacillus humicola TaxID=3110540 RepID=UPI00237B9E57|nr:DUF6483 family protein [Paenibacillus humicola]
MFQRDYFMRLIGQMTEAVGQVMGLRRQQKQEEALQLIDEELNKRFRLNGVLIRSLSDEDLVRIMTTNGVVETANLHAISLLLKEEADIHAEMNRPELEFPVRLKAFQLFMRLAILDAPPMLRTPSEEAEEQRLKLADYELPEQTKRLMLEWHELEGRYDQAENVLFELLEDGAAEPEEAADFYSRLLLLPEESLAAGGLPKEEVQDGLERISKQKQA